MPGAPQASSVSTVINPAFVPRPLVFKPLPQARADAMVRTLLRKDNVLH